MEQGKCAVCGVASKSNCSRCKQAYYCGREHQVADWKTHKLVCGKKQNDTN